MGGGRGDRRARRGPRPESGERGGSTDRSERVRRVQRDRVEFTMTEILPIELHDAGPDDDIVAARIWWRCDRDEAAGPLPDEPLAWEHLRHLRVSGRMVIATTTDGEPVGFGGVVERNGITRLADLFIDPDHQGRGVGQALLREVLGDAAVLTTSASADPRALPLYTRAGMRPLWPYHFLVGDPRKVEVPETMRVEPASPKSSLPSTPRPRASNGQSTTSTTRSGVERRGCASSSPIARSASPTSSRRSRGHRRVGSC